MSSNKSSGSKQGTIGAAELVAALRQFEPLIPEYTHLTNEQIITLRRAATLSPEWVETAVNAVGASATVQTVLGTSYEDLRYEINDIHRWSEVESVLRGMLQGVMAATLIRRHRLGIKVLQAYGIIRQLIRQDEHKEDLLTIYETLRQMNKLGKRKKKVEKVETPACSSPPPSDFLRRSPRWPATGGTDSSSAGSPPRPG